MTAAGGTTCPLCRKYASLTVQRKLYRHRGADQIVGSAKFFECRASGFSLEMADLMRKNKDAGRHPYRCEDGTWIGATSHP